MRDPGLEPAVPHEAAPSTQDGHGAGPPFTTPPCARRPGYMLPWAVCVVPCAFAQGWDYPSAGAL